jgi:hypothetical protein
MPPNLLFCLRCYNVGCRFVDVDATRILQVPTLHVAQRIHCLQDHREVHLDLIALLVGNHGREFGSHYNRGGSESHQNLVN